MSRTPVRVRRLLVLLCQIAFAIALKATTQEIIMRNLQLSAILAAAALLASGAVFAQNTSGNSGPGSQVPNDKTNYPNKTGTPNSSMKKSAMNKSAMNTSTTANTTTNNVSGNSAHEISKPKTNGPQTSQGPH
jgi:hypothetical protein